jgi:phage tail-like protein
MATKRKNPYAAFNFVVTLSGMPTSSGGSGSGGASNGTSGGSTSSGTSQVTIGAFMEASGLDGENAIIEYREGADQNSTTGTGGSASGSGGSASGKTTGAFVRKLPGLERYPNVTLRRGICGDMTLWNLRQAIRDGTNGPEFNTALNAVSPTLTIELQNEIHATVVTWTLHNVWVSKLSGPSLNAKANEIAVEAVEIVCERIDLS